MEKEVFALQTMLEQVKITESQKTTELFKARASVLENLANENSSKCMPEVISDGFQAPPVSTVDS